MNPNTKSTQKLCYRLMHGLLAFVYVCVIGGVSVYDIFLTIRYQESLWDLELNPVGRWIMNLDRVEIPGVSPCSPPNVVPFLAAKSLGTLLVIGVVVGLVFRLKRFGHPVGLGVSGFQLVLAAYLTYW